MHEDPDVIYLQPHCCADSEMGQMWCKDDVFECPDGIPGTKYVKVKGEENGR